MNLINVIAWLVLGGIAGWIASKIMGTDSEQGPIANIIVGIIGAVLGGWLARALGGSGVTGFNLYSLLIAIVGAVVLLFFYRMFIGRKRGRAGHHEVGE